MRRRRALAVLGSALGTPVLMSQGGLTALIAWGQRVREGPMPLADGASQEAGLTDMQAKTMEALAEVIIPETDTPGASEAGVSEFVDTLVRGWLDPPQRDRLLGGLDSVDEMARARYGTGFSTCAPVEQAEIVGELDEELTRLRTDASTAAEGHFFHDVKHFTLAGYFTSRVGLEALGHRIIHRDFEGCAPLVSMDNQVPRPAHEHDAGAFAPAGTSSHSGRGHHHSGRGHDHSGRGHDHSGQGHKAASLTAGISTAPHPPHRVGSEEHLP